MANQKIKLSVVIPVFNEQATINQIIKKVIDLKLPKQFNKEIIVVDDHSTDNTQRLLKKFKKSLKVVRHDLNLGKGSAVRTGFKNAIGDYVIIQDADLEYDPLYINDLLLSVIGGSQVVYGTRLRFYPLNLWGKHKTVLPLHWFGNKFLTKLTNILYGSSLTDMETCYKLLPKSALSRINLKSNKFDIEAELTAKILKLGYKIEEVPIKVIPRTHKEGKKISWKDGFAAVWALVKYRFVD
jgi:glycosyltransferase involved in cell wall biosynthesis